MIITWISGAGWWERIYMLPEVLFYLAFRDKVIWIQKGTYQSLGVLVGGVEEGGIGGSEK